MQLLAVSNVIIASKMCIYNYSRKSLFPFLNFRECTCQQRFTRSNRHETILCNCSNIFHCVPVHVYTIHTYDTYSEERRNVNYFQWQYIATEMTTVRCNYRIGKRSLGFETPTRGTRADADTFAGEEIFHK